MVADRIGSVYETPRLCLPCGQEFIPERRSDGRIADYCSDACRRNAHRRQNNNGFGIGGSERHRPTRIRPERPTTVLSLRPGRKLMSGPHPNPKRIKRPEAVPSYGQRIVAERVKRGWLQQTLADMIGVHRNSLAGWELGRNEPPISKFAAIAQAFDISLDELFGRGEPCTHPTP